MSIFYSGKLWFSKICFLSKSDEFSKFEILEQQQDLSIFFFKKTEILSLKVTLLLNLWFYNKYHEAQIGH